MSKSRNLSRTKERALLALSAFPHLEFAQIAALVGISRMHLYRLAKRFPDVQREYKFCLELKEMEAEQILMDGAMGFLCSLREFRVAGHKAMRYQYYQTCWKKADNKIELLVLC